jgi:hypothetical protein
MIRRFESRIEPLCEFEKCVEQPISVQRLTGNNHFKVILVSAECNDSWGKRLPTEEKGHDEERALNEATVPIACAPDGMIISMSYCSQRGIENSHGSPLARR